MEPTGAGGTGHLSDEEKILVPSSSSSHLVSNATGAKRKVELESIQRPQTSSCSSSITKNSNAAPNSTTYTSCSSNSKRPKISTKKPPAHNPDFQSYIEKLRFYLSQSESESPPDYNGKILKYLQLIRIECRNNQKSRYEVVLRQAGLIGEFIKILGAVDSGLPENLDLVSVLLTLLGNSFALDYGAREEQKAFGFLKILSIIFSNPNPTNQIICRGLKALGNLLYQKDCRDDCMALNLICHVIGILHKIEIKYTNDDIFISGIRVLRVYGSGNDEGGGGGNGRRSANSYGCTKLLSKLLSQVSISTTSHALIVELLRTFITYTNKYGEVCLLSYQKMSKTDNKTVGSLINLLKDSPVSSSIYSLTMDLIRNLMINKSVALIFVEQKFYQTFFTKLSTLSITQDYKLIGLHLKLLQTLNSTYAINLLPVGRGVGMEVTFKYLHEKKFEPFHNFLWTLLSAFPQWKLKRFTKENDLVNHIQQGFEDAYGIVNSFREVHEKAGSHFRDPDFSHTIWCEKHQHWGNWDVNLCISETEEEIEEQVQTLEFSPAASSYPSPSYSLNSGSGWSPGSIEHQDSDSGGYSPISSPIPMSDDDDGGEGKEDDQNDNDYSESENEYEYENNCNNNNYKISRWASVAKRLSRVPSNDTQTYVQFRSYLKIETLTGILQTINSISYLQIPQIQSLTPSILSLLVDILLVSTNGMKWEKLQAHKLYDLTMKYCKTYMLKSFDRQIIPPLYRACMISCSSKILREFFLADDAKLGVELLCNALRNENSARIIPYVNYFLILLYQPYPGVDFQLLLSQLRQLQPNELNLKEELLGTICLFTNVKPGASLNELLQFQILKQKIEKKNEDEVITLQLDDNSTLLVSKNRLISLSPVFEAMLSGSFVEGNHRLVKLANVSSKAGKFLFQSDSPNHILYKLDLNVCMELLLISQQYLISSVYRRICNYIFTQHLCHFNAPWIYTNCATQLGQMDKHEGIEFKSLRLKALYSVLTTSKTAYAVQGILSILENVELGVVVDDIASIAVDF